MIKEDVYISYAWGGKSRSQEYEEIVSKIEKSIKKEFNVIIDKKTLKYKGNIQEFENKLGNGSKIILVVSDGFLKSKHCMYEILRIHEAGNLADRIFPVVLSDADIYSPKGKLKYSSHWEKEMEKLEREVRKHRSVTHLQPIQRELEHFSKFREITQDILHVLSNMNTLTPDAHQNSKFKDLLEALRGGKRKPAASGIKTYAASISNTKKLFESAIKLVKEEVQGESRNAVDILEKLKEFHLQCVNQTFQIAVIALIKAGKSTFLNSLLGDEFLPMSNVPETSVPIKIIHSANRNGTLYSGPKKIDGADEIKKYLGDINDTRRAKGFKHDVDYVLEASFKVLEDRHMTDVRFEVLDTPGFGEAVTQITIGKSIDESSRETIDKISAIIYLLDYTKLKSTGEDDVLDMLVEMRADILDQIKDRIFFIINKIDEEDRNSLPPEEVAEFVFEIVKRKMPQVLRANIFTLSASHALLSRLVLFDRATAKARQDFGKIAFGIGANKRTDAEFKGAAKELLQQSQILKIEEGIINHIFENRSRIFIEGLQGRLKQLLFEFKNKYITTAKGALSKTIHEIEELEVKIEEAKKKQENIQDEADRFESEIKLWIETEFKGFEKTIADHIDSAFNFEKSEEKQSVLNRIIPNWVRKIQNFIRDAESESNADRDGILTLVNELNKLVSLELRSSFTDFRRELEQKILSRQSVLFERLRSTINSLARDFEATLKKALHINLEIVELRLEGLNADTVLESANVFVDKFIKSNYKVQQVAKEKTVFVKGSWCESDRYEKRMVFEPEWIQVNNINKASIELYWQKQIETMNTNAKAITNHLIEGNIKSQIKIARNSFNSYVSDYMSTVHEQKVRLSSQSKEHIEERLAKLNSIEDNISQIIFQLQVG